MKTLSLDYLVLSETKIVESFPTSQFNFEGYEIRTRRDRGKYGGGLIEFVRRGHTCKRLRDYDPKYSECLCSELTFTNKKWICFSIYSPPESSNLCLGYDKLHEFCDLFNLTNLIKSATCFTKNHKSLIDLFLINTPFSFHKSHVSETGLSDYYKLITNFFKANFSCLSPKI